MGLNERLSEFGCEVLMAGTGEEGLRMARAWRPHLIVLDLLMPEMNGWEVMQELSKEADLRDIPVVLVSALPGGAGAGALGVVDFLPKARREVPYFTPSVVVVTAQDLGCLELQRLNEDTVAVLQKNGELEIELRRVLQELWGGTLTEPTPPLVAAAVS